MNDKTLLIDFDGVIVQKVDYFSLRAVRLYPKADHDAIKNFFVRGEYVETEKGKKDLFSILEKKMNLWQTGVNTEQFLRDWFDPESIINESVINEIQRLRNQGIQCIIATNHSQYRKSDIWKNLELQNLFDDIITSSDVGAKKNEKDFFEKTLQQFNLVNLQSVTLIDDDQSNILCAQKFGIRGELFIDIDTLKILTIEML